MRGGEATRSGKRPLRSLTVSEKIDAINRVHDGESKASVARDIGVPESTLRGWCKSEPKIRSMARNSSTPESEADSPTSLSGANMYTSNAGASHSSEDEGPAMKRFKTASDMPLSFNSGVESTENSDTKNMDRTLDYQATMQALPYNTDINTLLLQQLGLLSPTSSNFLPMAQPVPNMNTVGLVENGLQYTKSRINPTSTNNKRYSIAAIAPSQLETVSKLSARKSLPPAAEAPATPVAASPDQQMPVLASAYNKNGVSNPRKFDDVLWRWLLQQKNQLGETTAQHNAQLCQDGSWFWQGYKQCGFPATSVPAVATTTPATKKSPSKARAILDSVLCNNNIENMKISVKEEVQDIPSSIEEAVEHGDKFFKYLEKCSDPSMTRLQLMKFRFLLDNLKTCQKKTSTGFKQSRK